MAKAPVKHQESALQEKSNTTSRKPTLTPYYFSVSRKYKIAKYITSFVLVIFLILSFTFMRNDITLENLRYLLKFISFTNTETSITATKINYASGDPNRLELFVGDLCSLTPNVYALYDSRGNQIMSERISYSSPVLKTGKKYTLCYDFNGTSFTIFNSFAKIYEETLNYPITNASISDSGSFAIAVSSKEYRTAVILYNDDFKPISKIYKNNYLMGLEISKDGSSVAVLTVGAQNGAFVSELEVVAVGSDEVLYKTSFDGLSYKLYQTNSGYISITDKAIYFFNDKLEVLSKIMHEYNISMSECENGNLTVAYSSGIIATNHKIYIYSEQGKLLYNSEFDGKLTAIDSTTDNNYVFVLAGNTLHRINLLNKKYGSIDVISDSIDVLSDTADTVLVATNGYAITYKLNDFTEEYYLDNTISESDNNSSTDTSDTTAVDTEIK